MALKPLHDDEKSIFISRPIAPMWARGLAFFIDIILLGAVWYALWTYAQGVAMLLAPVAVPIQVAMAVIYFAIFDGPSGAPTPGKMALNIRTIDQATLDKLPFGAALVRSFVKLTPFIIMIVGAWLTGKSELKLVSFATAQVVYQFGLGCLLANLSHMIISPRGQGLHDVLASSISGREPIGEAMAQYLGGQDLAEADRQMRPGKTSLMILIVITAMSSCQIGRFKDLLDDKEVAAALQFNKETREQAELEGALPDIVRIPPANYNPDDDVTTLSLRFRYVYSHAVDGEKIMPAAVESSEKIFKFWDDNMDRFTASYAKLRSPDGPKIVQFQEVVVEVVERSSIFYSHLLERTVGSEVLEIRYPPDNLIPKLLEESAALQSASKEPMASLNDSTTTTESAAPPDAPLEP